MSTNYNGCFVLKNIRVFLYRKLENSVIKNRRTSDYVGLYLTIRYMTTQSPLLLCQHRSKVIWLLCDNLDAKIVGG